MTNLFLYKLGEPRYDLTTSKRSLSLTSKALIFSLNFRPGVWVSPDNLLFLYRVMAELCSINKIAPTDPAHHETYSLVPSFEVKI